MLHFMLNEFYGTMLNVAFYVKMLNVAFYVKMLNMKLNI